MSENMYICGNCGFKLVESALAKSLGNCPKCGKGRADLKSKYGAVN